ncbi:phenol 2-monooxygenase, partial [Aureobasidium melanogenum]
MIAASDEPKESNVDVLIIGAGPAGLMMTEWMAKCGIRARTIDKRGTKIFNGQADGLQCRTLEIFDSFDFADRAWKESNHMLEICLWNPDQDGVIRRGDRIPDTIPGISRFQQVVLHQGRIERFFLDSIHACSDIHIERGVIPTDLEIDESRVEDPDAYPVTVTLRHLSEEEATPKQSSTSANGVRVQDGLFRSNMAPDDTQDMIRAAETMGAKANTQEIVHAKYVLGADGAHSWVRNKLGFKLEGESTDYIWGVLDIVPITDFPDIRMRCAIHSASHGSVMVIPRENKLVHRSKINPEVIIQSAQRIMAPYKIEYRKLDCPKAGQGMNVSMQDAYNLGWKVANVVKGLTDRSILKTYQSERRRIAQDLIDFDHRFSRLFSGRPAKDVMDEEGISMDVFKEAFEKGNMFASGIAVNYGSSMIVAKEGDASEQGDGTNVSVSALKKTDEILSKQSLATNLEVGKRMPSVKVLNQSDARPSHFQELLKSTGVWRVVLFAGDVSNPGQMQRLHSLGEKLQSSDSFLQRFTPVGARYDSVIEVLTVHAAPRTAVSVLDFPEACRPFDPTDGWDYWKVFVDDKSYHEGHGQMYQNYGINPSEGCAVILRPDQYISYVGPMDAYEEMDGFFSAFMISQDATRNLPKADASLSAATSTMVI